MSFSLFAQPVLLWWFWLALFPALPAKQQAPVTLAPGQTVVRSLGLEGPGEKHSYEIRVEADQCLEVVVDQREVDVALALLGADGKKLVETNSWRAAPEILLFIAPAAGNYRLELSRAEPETPPGRYQATLAPLRPATERERELLQARQLFQEAASLTVQIRFAEAQQKAEQALLLREKVFGGAHLEVAAALNLLGRIYEFKSELAQGEALYRRALTLTEQALGREHIDLVRVLNDLAALCHYRGDYAQARQLYLRSLAIREKWLGAEHLSVATLLNNLANLYADEGDYVQAERQQLRALAIRMDKLGAEHPNVAASYTNLGILYLDKGDYTQAETFLRRALPIFEKTLGADHSNVAFLRHQLGRVSDYQKDEAQAEAFYQQALQLWEKKLGPQHPLVAQGLHTLAGLHAKKGQTAQAEAEYQRALSIREKNFGPEHPEVAATLNALGELYLKRPQTDLAQAESLLPRALEILLKALGEHPQTAQVLGNLAQLSRLKGDLQATLAYASRASEMRERQVSHNVLPGSERQKLEFLNLFTDETAWLLSLHTQFAPRDSRALGLAFTTLLRRKGRALDAMSNNIAALRSRAQPQDQALFNQLVAARAQLAALTLRGPDKRAASYRSQLTQQETEVERLEAELSSRSAEFRAQSRPITLAAVQSALPPGAALIDFALYQPDDSAAAQRYAAYLLTAQGQPQWVDLGAAAGIDDAVQAWRQALREPQRTDAKRLARAVDKQLLQPVRALLGAAEHLLISPDGLLNLIPFAALVDEQNRYLVERYTISYLTSGRDLLRLQESRASQTPPLVVADPLFGEPGAPANAVAQNVARRRSITTGGELSETYFAPLFGSAQEARALKTLLRDATVLTGAAASEGALKQVNAPRLLHIATHGFFLSDKQTNPLLRSGLALAQANLRKQPATGEDGILTALEASGLNLWGTRLVTLSACDTGLGEVRNGEGVYGLRRAFALAGAETLVMSLWPVSDLVTRELMTAFYTNLQQGQGRAAALRAAQLRLLKQPGRRAPYYWASFIQAGAWGALDSQR